MFRRIMVPIDGSPTSNQGLKEAIALATDPSARLCLLHVVDELVVTQGFDGAAYIPENYIDEFIEALRKDGKKLLARAEERVKKSKVKVETVLLETLGHRVAELIIRQAKKWHADVIVLGTHGRRGLSRLLMGSDAEMVVREAPVPVLLVRSPKRPQRKGVRRS
ncbi:MAG TPA: universal stress protein [Casimicrobiaceae bacterium]|nr:universal stress protein [Casimicrobiaceae bacterium]